MKILEFNVEASAQHVHFSGSNQLGRAAKWLREKGWNKLVTVEQPTLLKERLSAYCLGIPEKLMIIYLPFVSIPDDLQGLNGGWFSKVLPIKIDGAGYHSYWLSPESFKKTICYNSGILNGPIKIIEMGEAVRDTNGMWQPPPKPSIGDWLLVIEK